MGAPCSISWSCLIAAIFSVIGDLLAFLSIALHYRKSHYHDNRFEFYQLQPELIQEEWDLRRDQFPLDTAAGLFNAVTWVILCIPFMMIAFRMAQEDVTMIGVHAAIGVLAISATNMEFLSIVSLIGSMSSLEWISNEFNLDLWLRQSTSNFPDEVGWRALEVTFIGVRGAHLWVNALEHLFSAAIMFLFFFAINNQRQGKQVLSRGFASFSLFLSAVFVIDFAFEVLRFVSWRLFASLALLVAVFSRFLLWPIWLIWLGRQVYRTEFSVKAPVSMSSSGPSEATNDASDKDADGKNAESAEAESTEELRTIS